MYTLTTMASIMYCTWAACCEGMGVHLMHTVLYNMRLCEVWVCKQLDEGWDEAPHPTDCQTTAAMIDIVLIVMWYIDHTIKTNMVDLYLHMQCVTVAISHPLLVSCTHVDIFVSIYTHTGLSGQWSGWGLQWSSSTNCYHQTVIHLQQWPT